MDLAISVINGGVPEDVAKRNRRFLQGGIIKYHLLLPSKNPWVKSSKSTIRKHR